MSYSVSKAEYQHSNFKRGRPCPTIYTECHHQRSIQVTRPLVDIVKRPYIKLQTPTPQSSPIFYSIIHDMQLNALNTRLNRTSR